jgi:hypothetical protein
MAKSAQKAGKPWTGAEDKIIVKLVKQRVSTSQIAKTLRRSPGAVRSHVSQKGISLVAKGR